MGEYRFPSGGLVGVPGLPYPRGVRLSAFPRERTWCDPGWRAGFIVGCFAPVPPDAAVLAPGSSSPPVRGLHPIGTNPRSEKFLQNPPQGRFLKKNLLKSRTRMHKDRHENVKNFCNQRRSISGTMLIFETGVGIVFVTASSSTALLTLSMAPSAKTP